MFEGIYFMHDIGKGTISFKTKRGRRVQDETTLYKNRKELRNNDQMVDSV